MIRNEAPDISGLEIDVISSFKEITNFTVMCYKADSKSLKSALRKIGFMELADKTSLTPEKQIAEYKKEIAEYNKEIEAALKEIEKCLNRVSDIEFMIDYMNIRKEKYEALNELAMTKNTFILTCFIPEKYSQ